MNRQVVRFLLCAALALTSSAWPGLNAAPGGQPLTQAPLAMDAPAQPKAVQADSNITYVFKTDLAAGDYKTFFESNDYGVRLARSTSP